MANNLRNMRIYHLPYLERTNLCRILDQSSLWEELGVTHMRYDRLTVTELRNEVIRGNSPSEKLLTMWGHQNHTVLELFVLLRRIKLYQAMIILKDFVDVKYHRWLRECPQNLDNLMQEMRVSSKVGGEKKSDLIKANLDAHSRKVYPASHKSILLKDEEEKMINSVKIENNCNVFVMNSDENNESNNLERQNDAGQDLPKQEFARQNIAGLNIVGQNIAGQNIAGQHVARQNVARHDVARQDVPRQEAVKPSTPRTMTATDISCVTGSAGAVPQITYEELQQSTNNWNPSSILGKGGFGTVFKGIWKCTQVAIKRIERKDDQPEAYNEQVRQSITELHCLNAYRHDNVLPLYGYSIGGPQPCLVYQYMSGGCLDRRLRVRDPTKALNWPSRLNIAIGTARGLQFLHTIGTKPLIHGDIKPANILLDHNDQPRIGDFGLAREGPQSDYSHITVSRIHGTRPYLPDEFLRGRKFSTKVDTYSFGIVLFEIGTSLSAYSEQRDKDNKFLKDFIMGYEGELIELKDKRAEGGDRAYRSVMEIGKLCVNKRSKDRPEMVAVLIQLEGVCI